jgi:hypothetical protein
MREGINEPFLNKEEGSRLVGMSLRNTEGVSFEGKGPAEDLQLKITWTISKQLALTTTNSSPHAEFVDCVQGR